MVREETPADTIWMPSKRVALVIFIFIFLYLCYYVLFIVWIMLLSLYNPAGGNVHNPVFLSTCCTAENFIPTYSVFTAELSTGCLLVIHSFNIHNKLVDFGGKERVRFHFFFYYVARVHDGAVVAVELPADFRQGQVRQFRG